MARSAASKPQVPAVRRHVQRAMRVWASHVRPGGPVVRRPAGCVALRADDARQGLPRPLVVPAGRGRVLQLRRAGGDRACSSPSSSSRASVRSSTTARTGRSTGCPCRRPIQSTVRPELRRAGRDWSSARSTTGPRSCSWPPSSPTSAASSSPGAFRRPREINWLVGVTMLLLAHGQRVHRLLAARRPAVGHRACASPTRSCCRSRWSAPGSPSCSSAAPTRPTRSSAGCSCSTS